MKSKETGSIFIGKCPICGDELIVGWLRDGESMPYFDPKAKQKIATKDADEVAKDKQTCTCGNISASFDPKLGRAKFEWNTDEPPVGNVNLH